MPTPKSWLILALSGATVLGLGGLQVVRTLRSRALQAAGAEEPPARPIPADDLSGYLKTTYGQPELEWPGAGQGEFAAAVEPIDQPGFATSKAATSPTDAWSAEEVPPLHAFLTEPTLGGMAQVIPTEAEEDEPVFIPFSPRPREDDLSDWYLPLDLHRLDEGMAYPGDFSLAQDPELRWIGGKLWALAASRLPASEDDEATITSTRHTYTVRRLDTGEGDTYIHLRRQPKDFGGG